MITYKKACLGALASAAMLLCAAQAQAQTFAFDQRFDLDGFLGNVRGTFTAVDANTNTVFEASEMTFLTLEYVGIAPTLGMVSLVFTPPNILVSTTTQWFPNDRTLGDGFNGFFLDGTSLSGTQMTWVAGPGNFFSYGNTPGSNAGGDPQNSNALVCGFSGTDLCRFGQITLSPGGVNALPFASSQSDEYVTTAIPEPSTYLMMLGGVAALALKVRRRAA